MHIARETGVRCIAQLATKQLPQRIIFERDAATERNDRRWLHLELAGYPEVEYQLLGKREDPMLWVADGIAWAVHKGGRWRAMIDHLITAVLRETKSPQISLRASSVVERGTLSSY